LKRNITDFLGVANSFGMKIGLVFFDDCWNGGGADLNQPCVPRKGMHNGCWYQSPQAVDRTTVDRFQNYVTDIVQTFDSDERVLWFEISNEPNKDSNFSLSLRDAGYCWAKALNPVTPVIALWDDNEATDIVDHHQYHQPWYPQPKDGGVFSNPTKGGFITEAGARWYQKTDNDVGSPLTLVHWLEMLRANVSLHPAVTLIEDVAEQEAKHERLMAQCDAMRHSGAWSKTHKPPPQMAHPIGKTAPPQPLASTLERALVEEQRFVPGVMIDWEVMVGHSQTRWHWGDAEGSAEPPIPWHGHIFPDGTPVSFTEAATIRRYTTGVDDFLAVDTFLDNSTMAFKENYGHINTAGFSEF